MLVWCRAVGAARGVALGRSMRGGGIALGLWEQRVLVFGLFSAAFILGGFILVGSLRRQAAQPTKLFRSSLAELETDMTQLRRRDHH